MTPARLTVLLTHFVCVMLHSSSVAFIFYYFGQNLHSEFFTSIFSGVSHLAPYNIGYVIMIGAGFDLFKVV